MKRVIAIAPHPDDEVIGCGGTLLKHVANGDKVIIVYITNGEIIDNNIEYETNCEIRKHEAIKVCNDAKFTLLNWPQIASRKIQDNYSIIQNDVIKIFRSIKPEIIYLPHKYENDNDHSLTFRLVKEAYWLSKISLKEHPLNTVTAQLRGYEVWTPMNEINIVSDISIYKKQKKELINAYNSQTCRVNYADGILGLNRYRAALNCYDGYIEAFSTVAI